MKISDDQIKELIASANIVETISRYIEVVKKGRSFWAVCPFHDDSKPSLSISESKNIFKCFSCNEGGNVIYFVMKYESLSYPEAIKKLANEIGMELNISNSFKKTYSAYDEKVIEVLHQANIYFQYCLGNTTNKKLQEYCKERNLTKENMEKFQIGWCPNSKEVINFLNEKFPDKSLLLASGLFTKNMKVLFENRIIFPIHNSYADVVGFSGRVISPEEPKYKNSSESNIFKKSKLLYNFHNAIKTAKKTKKIIITEGFFDVFALHYAGYENAIAVMGTALTRYHASMLKNFQVILFLDSDRAGISATIKSIKILQEYCNNIEIVINNSKMDPDEIYFKKSKKALIEVLNNKLTALQFIYKIVLQKKKKNNISLEMFIELINRYYPYASQLDQDIVIDQISKLFTIDIDIIRNHLSRAIKPSKSLPVFNKSKEEPTYIPRNATKYIENPKVNIVEPKSSKKNRINNEISLLKIMIHKHFLTFIKSILENKNICDYLSLEIPYYDDLMERTIFILKKVHTNKESLKEASKDIKLIINEAKSWDKSYSDKENFASFINKFTKIIYNIKIKFIQAKLQDSSLSIKEKNKLLEDQRELKLYQGRLN